MQPTHQKHPSLSKPNFGNFARNECAFMGTTCDKIKQLAFQLTKILSNTYKIAYIDADHKSVDIPILKESALSNGAFMEYTDKITHHRFETYAKQDIYQYRVQCNEADLVLVNGNHFEAKRQILVIDPKKFTSLEKKVKKLTDVAAIILLEENQVMPNFLCEQLPHITILPRFLWSETDKMADFFLQNVLSTPPPLYGLVLAGGKSQRMGHDKGQINYHGKPQREYMSDLLAAFCQETYLSCRPEQMQDIPKNYTALPDSFSDLGPYGAILSAFRHRPNVAWFVVACDLPLLDADALQQLIENRNPSKIATAFNSPDNEFPEPLITIWEPKSYMILLQFLAQGFSCPRKVLINNEIQLINSHHTKALTNVNDATEYARIQSLISKIPISNP
jgi:molybdenum cofactor guanylyltransferase